MWWVLKATVLLDSSVTEGAHVAPVHNPLFTLVAVPHVLRRIGVGLVVGIVRWLMGHGCFAKVVVSGCRWLPGFGGKNALLRIW